MKNKSVVDEETAWKKAREEAKRRFDECYPEELRNTSEVLQGEQEMAYRFFIHYTTP